MSGEQPEVTGMAGAPEFDMATAAQTMVGPGGDADSEASTSDGDFVVDRPTPHNTLAPPASSAEMKGVPKETEGGRAARQANKHKRWSLGRALDSVEGLSLHSSNTTGTQRTFEPSVKEEEWLSLNVGGTVFRTTRSTLELAPSSMLARMASKDWKSVKDETGAYLLDRDPNLFKPVLNFLRCGLYIPSPGVSELAVLEEARFFNIQALIDVIMRRLKNPPVRQYVTVMYKESSRSTQYKYSVYPIRVEGPVEEEVVTSLNGGKVPPPGRTFPATSVYGEPTTGWSIKDVFLTTVYNTLAMYGWSLVSTSGHGAGGDWGQDSGHLAVFTKEKAADSWDLCPSHTEQSFMTDPEEWNE